MSGFAMHSVIAVITAMYTKLPCGSARNTLFGYSRVSTSDHRQEVSYAFSYAASAAQ
jgi:hypothetical protein